MPGSRRPLQRELRGFALVLTLDREERRDAATLATPGVNHTLFVYEGRFAPGLGVQARIYRVT